MKSISYDPNQQEERGNRKWFNNVKLIGEIDKGTSIYIEDYAYTYLHQCAKSNQSYELCTVLIGECNKEAEQVVIYGVIPVEATLLDQGSKWIDENVLGAIEDERERYFPKGDYVGWMHTQPGYGIIPTTQEMAVHLDIFGENNILMLIDPVYDAEAFFTCSKGKFEEKQGFCVYYEKNEQMQKYMEDHSVIGLKEQVASDKAVDDFRQLGARRKEIVDKKRRKSLVMNITWAGVLLTTAFIIGIQSQQKKMDKLQRDMVDIHYQYSEIENRIPDNPVELVFTSQDIVEEVETEAEIETKIETGTEMEKELEIEEALESEPTAGLQSSSEYDVHAVEIGDSLLSISYNYYKTVGMAKEIAVLNSIENKDTIYIGQKLKLPKKTQ